MSFWQSLLAFLDTPMETPPAFGWFHLMWVALSFLVLIPLLRFPKEQSPDHVRKVVLATAIIVIILEIYKMINYSFSYENGIVFDYQWYAFPFQFCSTPMYIGLLAKIPLIGIIFSLVGSLIGLYALVGIVLSILVFVKVLK